MRILLTLLVISSLTVSGCSRWRESRVNPSNWFGNSRSTPIEATAEQETNPLIPQQTTIRRRDKREVYKGTLVDQVTDLAVERTAGGAIIRVTALSSRQGAYDVRLTSDTKGEPVDGVLTFSVKALQPLNTPQGPKVTRTINVARHVGRDTLDSVKTIRVVAARNVRTTQR